MLNSLLTILCLINLGKAYGQDYSNYYRLCNLADSLTYVGDQNKAIDTYAKAFSTVNYIHSEKYQRAYHLAIKLNRFDEAFHFGRNMIINSGLKSRIRTKSKEFKSSNYYQVLIDSCTAYIDLYNSRVNHE